MMSNASELSFNDQLDASDGCSSSRLNDRVESKPVMSPYSKSLGHEMAKVGA
jgi:hypothetical protein